MKQIRIKIVALLCLLPFFVFLPAVRSALAYETVTAVIPVNCLEVSGNDTHTYEVKIETYSKDAPRPASDTLSIGENKTASFEIELTEPGTFLYKIYEAAGEDSNIEYDSSSYEITVYAENDEKGGLRYTVTAFRPGRDGKNERVVFQDRVLSDSETPSAPEETKPPKKNTDKTDGTDTGDRSPVGILQMIMLFSVVIAVLTFFFKWERNEEDEV